jgi:hypothetical protein
MQYSKDGVYNLYRTIKNYLKHPTKGQYKKLMEKDFNYFTQFYYNNFSEWKFGAVYFVPLANALNCGKISIIELCSTFIGEFIIKNKTTTIKELNTIDKVKEFAKFYTVNETKKHFEYIKKLEEKLSNPDNVFDNFNENKNSVYQVNEQQKNMLYELVKEGKVNFFCFIFAWMKGKFEIDESKITDEDYKLFIQCMNIVRQNITRR